MNKRNRGRKLMRIFLTIVGVVITLNILGFVINSLFFRNELAHIEPYGKLVEVDGKKMHVYAMGKGKKTIVLLPGFGVPLPSADFGPLMRKLSENHTVVAIEYFGMGFSEETDNPRTNENYIHEIRTALSTAGFSSPYVLMPHSMSGIYAEYYATKHPEEVTAIIMLDTTSTAFTTDANPPRFIYSLGKIQQTTGLTRLVYSLVPDTKRVENGYTEQEKADYKRFAFHSLNDTLIEQSLLMMDNVKEVKAMPFPDSVPVLKLISQQSIDAMAKKDKEDGMGYQLAHLDRLGANTSYKVIDASHMLYQTSAAEIASLTQEFLAKVD